MRRKAVAFVIGTRPNVPKVAPIVAALPASLRPILVHTGQHYDPELSAEILADHGLGAPDHHLGAGLGSPAERMGSMLRGFEAFCREARPDCVVVVGDVDSTLAAALVASRLRIPLAHVEAGLRCGDRSMPEEHNRRVVDALSDRCYTHCREADEALLREGVEPERIVQAGNVMIDSLLRLLPRAEPPAFAPRLPPGDFALATLHRPGLVDHPAALEAMLEALAELAEALPVLLPLHPRTRARLAAEGSLPAPDDAAPRGWRGSRLLVVPPQRSLRFAWLMARARLLVTDSGGLQEESAVLGLPCVTVRPSTERPVTVRAGTNVVVGRDPAAMLRAARRALAVPRPAPAELPGWDGQAGPRIAGDLAAWLEAGEPARPSDPGH